MMCPNAIVRSRTGDRVLAASTGDEAWLYCTNQRTGRAGYEPKQFVFPASQKVLESKDVIAHMRIVGPHEILE